jgi:lipoprotein NlpD
MLAFIFFSVQVRRGFARAGTALGLLAMLAACSTPKPAPVAPTPKPAASAPVPSSVPAPPAAPAARLVWPVQGPVIGKFDGSRNKGIDIAGQAGAPVVAAEAGRVVYAGSELRGYGNLVIVKHSEQLLTAYAHNRKILVKENQTVRQGQRIAEMGSSGTDRVKLHFEVRRDGNAVDPMPYLPKP